uniref:Uncharacterized protein n=1 Tax=Fagus sylvatica TaxID=28930 RepID=A0A2N9J3C1_FAGSY
MSPKMVRIPSFQDSSELLVKSGWHNTLRGASTPFPKEEIVACKGCFKTWNTTVAFTSPVLQGISKKSVHTSSSTSKDEFLLLNEVQLVWGRDFLVNGYWVLVYVGHGGRIGFRDYVPIDEVLDIILETETLHWWNGHFSGGKGNVVKLTEVKVPSFGDGVGHRSWVK